MLVRLMKMGTSSWNAVYKEKAQSLLSPFLPCEDKRRAFIVFHSPDKKYLGFLLVCFSNHPVLYAGGLN